MKELQVNVWLMRTGNQVKVKNTRRDLVRKFTQLGYTHKSNQSFTWFEMTEDQYKSTFGFNAIIEANRIIGGIANAIKG